MIGWLINDCLSTIPGTKTIWNDLLEWIPCLIDKTNGYTDYSVLPTMIEQEMNSIGRPDFIIRNATYFRPLNFSGKTFSLLQDRTEGGLRSQQIDVCNRSTVTIFNSPYTSSLYPEITSKREIISLGIDSNHFRLLTLTESLDILPNSILYVGDSSNYPKGFDILLDLIYNTNYNFCLVMKDGFKIDHPRVKVFNRIDHDTLVKIHNGCKMLICTSREETQHLSGLEGGFSGLPILTSNVGIYFNRLPGLWGSVVKDGNFKEGIDYMMSNLTSFSPREYWLKEGLDKEGCRTKWLKVTYDNSY